MEEHERQMLNAKIKALENQITERTRNYLYQHRMSKKYGAAKTTSSQSIQVGNTQPFNEIYQQQSSTENDWPVEIQQSHQEVGSPASSRITSNTSKKGDGSHEIYSLTNNKNEKSNKKSHCTEENSDFSKTVKKQRLLKQQMGELKIKQNQIINELTQKITNLTTENQGFREKHNQLQEIIKDFREKYCRNSQLEQQTHKQSEQLMDNIAQLNSLMKNERDSGKKLEAELSIYKAKNDLLIRSLNESEEMNYQLRLNLQDVQRQSKNIALEFKQVSEKTYEALCNLPIGKHGSVYFLPQSKEELNEAIETINRFSQHYDQINSSQQMNFKASVKQIVEMFRKIVTLYRIESSQVIGMIKEMKLPQGMEWIAGEFNVIVSQELKPADKNEGDPTQFVSV